MIRTMTPARIKRLRRYYDLTQTAFAKLIGVAFVTVNRWERGRTSPLPLQHKVLLDKYRRTFAC